MDNEILKTLQFICHGDKSIFEVMSFLGVSYIGFMKIYGDYVGKYFYCNFETHPDSTKSIIHITDEGKAALKQSEDFQ
jgi:hypothetical protein